MILQACVLGFVTLQRGAELLLANRNTRRLLARGAVEASPGHYPLIVILHAAWLGGLWLLALQRPVQWGWLAAFAFLQAARLWVLATLGERWTTRIIILPGAAPVRRGPYRFFPHPNYLVVALEILALPMAFGLWAYALAFSVLNGVVLTVRIRAEDKALGRGAPG